jgi:O-antigen ligase
MFQDRPLLGIGLGGFAPEILGPYRSYIPEDRRSAPTSLQHTEVVRVAAETGIAGLAAFAAFILAVAIALRRAARGADPDDLVVVIAFATIGLTILLSAQMEGRFFSEPYLWLYLGALAAFVRIRTASPARSTPLA